MPQSKNTHKHIVLATILGLALILRMAWIFILPSIPVSDFGWYYDRAVSILSQGGFAINGRATAQFPPGYPYFLALLLKLLGSLTGIKIAQAVIGVFTCYLIYRLANSLTGKSIAIVAAALAAIYPNFILFGNQLASENLFMPLLLGGVVILVDKELTLHRLKRCLLSGVIFGIAALVRPAIAFIPVVVLIWLIASRENWRKAIGYSAIVAVVMIMVISPWTTRNYITFDRFVPISSNGGTVFWMGNAAGAEGERHFPLGNSVETAGNEFARSQVGYQRAIADIQADPGRFLKVMFMKYPHFFSGSDGLAWNIIDSLDHDWTRDNLRAPFFFRPLLGLDLTFSIWKRRLTVVDHMLWVTAGLGLLFLMRRKQILLILLVYAYWFAFHLVFAFGHPRFVMPLVPLNIILAAAAIVFTFERLKGWITARGYRQPSLLSGTTIAAVGFAGAILLSLLMGPDNSLLWPGNPLDVEIGIIFGLCLVLCAFGKPAKAAEST